MIITPEDEALLKALETRCFKRTGATEVWCSKAAARIRELLRDYELQRNILLEERKRK